jgi:hypothetical protein
MADADSELKEHNQVRPSRAWEWAPFGTVDSFVEASAVMPLRCLPLTFESSTHRESQRFVLFVIGTTSWDS